MLAQSERTAPLLEAERAELEAVTEALGRSSRLAHLLHYIGEKYFAGRSDQLTEYAIATEVFGRSKTTFDAGEDAIARVEAHRLRKRLKEYYEGAGKNHLVQLSIPPGSYLPSFVHKQAALAADLPSSVSEDGIGKVAAPQSAPPAAPRPKRSRLWMYAFSSLALASLAIAAYFLFPRFHAAPGAATPAHTAAQAAPAPERQSGLAPATVPLRLLAGYSGEPQTDSAGAVWDADRYFSGGGAWRRPDAPVARTSDPLLFQQWRTGDFSYNIPLRPGDYELHLYFVTSDRSSDSYSTFTVRINGNIVLTGFDINTDALGENIADERIFRDVTPAADGMLHIEFVSERGAPKLNALELLPGLPHKQRPIRLLMQRASYTDHSGNFWRPDNYFMNGRLSDQRQEIIGAPDPDLFDTERFGHFTYALPVDTRDRYTLILHFVEFYFGPQAPGGGGAGSRVFKVMCNGQTLLDNFDIYKEAGSLHVLTKTFYHLQPSAQGKLNVTFEPIVNNATVSGIEVLDENQ